MKTSPINKYYAKMIADYNTKWVSGDITNSSMLIEPWHKVRRQGQCAGEGLEGKTGAMF